MRLSLVMLAVGMLPATLGCHPAPVLTIPVMVRTSGVDSAALDVRLAHGVHEPALDRCPTPCLVTLPEDTSYALTLTAPGYYPATMTLAFDTVWHWRPWTGATLEVPMLRRAEVER